VPEAPAWDVIITPRAERELNRLDRIVASRALDAIERYARNGYGDVKQLQGTQPPQYRLRVGEHRVRFARDSAKRTLTVLRVLPRGRAYRD